MYWTNHAVDISIFGIIRLVAFSHWQQAGVCLNCLVNGFGCAGLPAHPRGGPGAQGLHVAAAAAQPGAPAGRPGVAVHMQLGGPHALDGRLCRPRRHPRPVLPGVHLLSL
eukprot:scaffold39613_cov39-Prasinocladus_malaysianus.AAC.1